MFLPGLPGMVALARASRPGESLASAYGPAGGRGDGTADDDDTGKKRSTGGGLLGSFGSMFGRGAGNSPSRTAGNSANGSGRNASYASDTLHGLPTARPTHPRGLITIVSIATGRTTQTVALASPVTALCVDPSGLALFACTLRGKVVALLLERSAGKLARSGKAVVGVRVMARVTSGEGAGNKKMHGQRSFGAVAEEGGSVGAGSEVGDEDEEDDGVGLSLEGGPSCRQYTWGEDGDPVSLGDDGASTASASGWSSASSAHLRSMAAAGGGPGAGAGMGGSPAGRMRSSSRASSGSYGGRSRVSASTGSGRGKGVLPLASDDVPLAGGRYIIELAYRPYDSLARRPCLAALDSSGVVRLLLLPSDLHARAAVAASAGKSIASASAVLPGKPASVPQVAHWQDPREGALQLAPSLLVRPALIPRDPVLAPPHASMALLQHCDCALIGSESGEAALVDPHARSAAGAVLARLTGHVRPVTAADVDSEEKFAVTGDDGGGLRVWASGLATAVKGGGKDTGTRASGDGHSDGGSDGDGDGDGGETEQGTNA